MTTWQSRTFTDDHDVAGFDCGVEDLNTWLQRHAARAQMAGTARTYVWTAEGSDVVVGYYAVAPTMVSREQVGRNRAGGFSEVPAYLLARLALERGLHGQGLGQQLLLDALETIVRAAETAGGRLIVVDAIDENAHRFYRHHDFGPIGDTMRLVMKVSTARESLREPTV